MLARGRVYPISCFPRAHFLTSCDATVFTAVVISHHHIATTPKEIIQFPALKLLGKSSRHILAGIDNELEKINLKPSNVEFTEMAAFVFETFNFAFRTDRGSNNVPATRTILTMPDGVQKPDIILRQWDSCEQHNGT